MGSISAIKFEVAREVPVSEILNHFASHGWTFADGDQITFLPLGDTGQYSWESDDLARGNTFVHELLTEKQHRNEIGGIVMTWRDSQIGGQLLIAPNKKQIDFICTINRVTLGGRSRITDLGWYLHRLAAPLEDTNMPIEIISMYQAF